MSANRRLTGLSRRVSGVTTGHGRANVPRRQSAQGFVGSVDHKAGNEARGRLARSGLSTLTPLVWTPRAHCGSVGVTRSLCGYR